MAGWGKYQDIRNVGYSGSDAVVFDDLQVNLSNFRVPSANAATERFYNLGIAGGIEFPVYGFAVNKGLFFSMQTTHSMKLSSVLENHLHFITPNDGTGKKFKFQLDVVAAGLDSIFTKLVNSPFSIEKLMTLDCSNTHCYLDLADLDAINTTPSTIYHCKISRIAASSDEYASEVYLMYNDSHYRKDTLGSKTEQNK